MTLPINSVSERSTCYLTVTFLDKNGNAAPPLDANYSLYCLTNDEAIREAVDLVVTDGSFEIELTAQDNALLNGANPYETKKVVVEANYEYDADGKPLSASVQEFQYDVMRVRRVTGTTIRPRAGRLEVGGKLTLVT